MSENFNWEGYRAAISALIPNTTAESKDPNMKLLGRATELNEKRESIISLRCRLTRSKVSTSDGLRTRVDEVVVIYNEMAKNLEAACKDEYCTPEQALAKVSKEKLKFMEVHLDELSDLLDQEIAEEEAKQEKRRLEREAQEEAQEEAHAKSEEGILLTNAQRKEEDFIIEYVAKKTGTEKHEWESELVDVSDLEDHPSRDYILTRKSGEDYMICLDKDDGEILATVEL